MSSAGSGYSRIGEFSLSRWREDATRDNWGQFFYIRNLSTMRYWSSTFQPHISEPSKYESDFSEDRIRFWRNDEDISTKTEIVVSPEDNVEMRRIVISNNTEINQQIEVTSFMELSMNRLSDDKSHPSFRKLFIETEFIENKNSLLAYRRRRSNHEKELWAFHTLSFENNTLKIEEYETNRLSFIGRGKTTQNPVALEKNKILTNSVGPILDPIFSIRKKLSLQAGETVRLVFSTGMVESKDHALDLIDKYSEFYTFERESSMAWTQSKIQLYHLKLTLYKAHLYQKLAGRMIYLDSSLRASSQTIIQNKRTQIDLWPYGISGDLPIILLEICSDKDLLLFVDILKAHEYMQLKGIIVDLVVLNISLVSYLQPLHKELHRLIQKSRYHTSLNQKGGVFILRSDLMPKEDVVLFRTVARTILRGSHGYLEDQLRQRKPRLKMPASFLKSKGNPRYKIFNHEELKLKFDNGIGGFCRDNNDYVINLKNNNCTPAPWINVISNSLGFGFYVSDSGSSNTWSINSRENRLTPWSNDPVSDPSGEAIYIRDEQTGETWSPTPFPIRNTELYTIRHGQGYTIFNHISHEIQHCLKVFVAIDDMVKISSLTIRNLSDTNRVISVTCYIEWVLGIYREESAPHIITEYDEEYNAILVRNPYNNEFAHRVSFLSLGGDIDINEQSYTCDRREFLGRNGSYDKPESLKRTGLSNSSGAGFDPCSAIMSRVVLSPGEEKTIVFLLGESENSDKAKNIIRKFNSTKASIDALEMVTSFWSKMLAGIQITTPDDSMNILVNNWLPYQVLSCRIWGRTALYQSGGAYGFRDQLQDVMSMIYLDPKIARKQIVMHSQRQFIEGDVQHWWHPPTDRGVRTKCSDDLVWLPFVVNFYIKKTGDYSILNEKVCFIESDQLEDKQVDLYNQPDISDEKASVYEHCARALDISLTAGRHGFPLIGSGDWNDGMNRVGHGGSGESVWLAWFLHLVINEFIPHCRQFKDQLRVERYIKYLNKLKLSIDQNAWDGEWYRRAFFDDGSPLGSILNEECQIDSISQSWSVLSGADNKLRSKQAMASLEHKLINWNDKIINLLTPAFDKSNVDPGYIKGYLPGVRENGGQYTHAAIWVIMAYAEMGDGEKATKLFHLLNPINHSLNLNDAFKYKVEPYVLAADVYGSGSHVGRGGWSWYTGSASWMYRCAIESILGFELNSNRFKINPRVPASWNSYRIVYLYKKTRYVITLKRDDDNCQYVENEWIEMIDDGSEHLIEVKFSVNK